MSRSSWPRAIVAMLLTFVVLPAVVGLVVAGLINSIR